MAHGPTWEEQKKGKNDPVTPFFRNYGVIFFSISGHGPIFGFAPPLDLQFSISKLHLMQLGIEDEDPDSRESTQGLPRWGGKGGGKNLTTPQKIFSTPLTSARSPLALIGSFSTLSGRGFGPSKPFLLFLPLEIPRPFPQL